MSNTHYETVERYHDNHNVEYTLMVTVDGEVLAKHTSSISADDVSGYAWSIDEQVGKQAVEDEQEKINTRNSDDVDSAIEDQRGRE